MIYAIVGTEDGKRKAAYKELLKLGAITNHLYSEHVNELQSLVGATSLFGDPIIVLLFQMMENSSSREGVVGKLSEMKNSPNIFIIDEPFADANRIKSLQKYSEKLYDARAEKAKEVDVFKICNLLGSRDKKEVWLEWMNIRDKETGEALQGILWWKWKMIWGDVLAGKRAMYTKEECETIGRKLLRAPILAHRGEGDLKLRLEEILLSI
jgi:hypothetical protein